MSMRTLLTTPLQILCKTIFIFKVIVQSITDPDENRNIGVNLLRRVSSFWRGYITYLRLSRRVTTGVTTLLQILCKIILNSKVIVKCITEPDENRSTYPRLSRRVRCRQLTQAATCRSVLQPWCWICSRTRRGKRGGVARLDLSWWPLQGECGLVAHCTGQCTAPVQQRACARTRVTL